MNIDGLDSVLVSKLITDQVESVTCMECCRYYIAPETAPCGHSLCHGCWSGRRTCPCCAAPVTRHTLKLNVPLRTKTEHVHNLADSFERLFDVKLDEIDLDLLDPKMQSNDPTKNVKEWLASSENHFSAPILSSQASTMDRVNTPIELNASKIQIHSHTKKIESPKKVIKTPQCQNDWDKIETISDTENIHAKNKENIVGPMDIEPFILDENHYNNDHPRRSNRKLVSSTRTLQTRSGDKFSSKNSESEMDKKSKTKQNWSNVKKMKKEFSKLNKVNKSKLNVSIEMCNKAQGAKAKANPPQQSAEKLPFNIEDGTPETTKKAVGQTRSDKNDSQNMNVSDKKAEKNVSSSDGIITNSNNNKASKLKTPVCLDNSGIKDYSASDKQTSTEDLQSSRNNEAASKSAHLLCSLGNSSHKESNKDTEVKIVQNEIDSEYIDNSEDVEVSIKVGNTITKIYIRQKQKDVVFKVNADSAIQTSLGPHHLSAKKMCDKGTYAQSSLVKETSDKGVNVHLIELELGDEKKVTVNKTSTTKLDTASADTVTAQDVITDTVEKELCDMMESVENDNKTKKSQSVKGTQKPTSTKSSQAKSVNDVMDNVQEDIDELNDLDMFASGSVKEANVHLLKNSKSVCSEILKPTLKSLKSQKVPDKRERDANDDLDVVMPSNKKQKVISQEKNKSKTPEVQNKVQEGPDSELLTYDSMMSKVFANIDADIENGKKSASDRKSQKQTEKEHPKNLSQIFPRTQRKTQTMTIAKDVPPSDEVIDISDVKVPQKDSENVFSMIENELQELAEKPQEVTENLKQVTEKPKPQLATNTQQEIAEILTPGMCRDLDAFRGSTQVEGMDVDMVPLQPVMGTPLMEDDDSDKSVVEETPQKNVSFQKPKPKSDASNSGRSNLDKLQSVKTSSTKESNANKSSESQIMQTVINITDTLTPGDSDTNKNSTAVRVVTSNAEAVQKGYELTTPLTIKKFVNQIKYKSTPVARKSLNFENSFDDEQTLCPTTTQEKEFMAKAFENTPMSPKKFMAKALDKIPMSPIKRTLSIRNSSPKDTRNYCLAGSVLSSSEIQKIKLLCKNQGWKFEDKYTDTLTHLVVAVDEEGKAQRTVKYMCALAASKWIVSFAWVERCLSSKGVVDEALYEALDAVGDPGPALSRQARTKLFTGITFYCMPPFSVLEIGTLQQIVKLAGGEVARSIQEVKVADLDSPRPGPGPGPSRVRLVLAEPETTQEDRFIYISMEQGIVPVNYEWVLNCLGMYSLCSIRDLLLCPVSLLPKSVATWPAVLLQDVDEADLSRVQ